MSEEVEEQKNKRNFVRYNVAELDILSSELQLPNAHTQLITFGEGGCGFLDRQMVVHESSLPKRVNCIFKMNSVTEDPVEVQGTLIYVKGVDMQGNVVYFYGVEFIPAHRSKIEPIVRKLDELEKQKLISLA